MTHLGIDIKEPFGIQWPLQYTLLDIDMDSAVNIKKLGLFNSLDQEIQADFIPSKNNKLTVGMILSLYPFETRKMYITEKTSASKLNKCLSIRRNADCITVSNGSLSLCIPSKGMYIKSEIPAPIISSSNINISAKGIWKEQFDKAFVKVRIENRALHGRIMIDYDFFEHGTYKATIEMHKGMSEAVITEKSDVCFSNSFLMSFSLQPSNTYARMHTPSKELGVLDEWKRIWFDTKKQSKPIYLQPFYSWDMDTATLIQYYNDYSGVSIVPIRAGSWKNAQTQRLSVHTDDSIFIEAPVNKGMRCWVFSLYNGQAFEKNNQIDLSTQYQNWRNMLDSPIERIYLADRLCAIYGGANLTKTLEWLRVLPQSVNLTPHVLADENQIQQTQKRIKNWSWMEKTIQEHKDDLAGFDPAGVYCAVNDEDYALKAKQCISVWLHSRILMFTTFGYSLHETVCIRLSRPIRLIAIDFDLTCTSKHYSDSDKQFIYSAFIFLMRAMDSQDYWPDRKNGFRMGNRNFHSDRFSALGILACLLSDYPFSQVIIKYVQTQINRELKYCIKDSGAWIEAPNYQAYSMNYLITLFTALKNSGHNNYFKNRRFISTLEFLCDIQTPYDVRYGAHMIPTLGDTAANYWSQSFSNVFAWAGKMTEGTAFSRKMICAWERAGLPVFSSGGELNSTFKMLLLTDNTLKSAKYDFKPLSIYEGFGVIARKDESYFCIKSGDISMHYDHDESSFIWYENNTPLLIDIGSQYFPAVDAAFMHNRISIDMKTDQSRGKVTCAKYEKDICLIVTVTEISEIQDWPIWPVTDPEWNFRYGTAPVKIDKHIWKRSLIYLMAHKALLVIDEVDGTLPFEQNFILCTESNSRSDGYYQFNGLCDMHINVWTFNEKSSEVHNWGYSGLDEPLFKKAFSMEWKDFTWMWDKPITNMAEEVQLLRNRFAPSSKAITFMSAYSSHNEDIESSAAICHEDTLEWTKNGKTIKINFNGLEDKPLSQIVKEY